MKKVFLLLFLLLPMWSQGKTLAPGKIAEYNFENNGNDAGPNAYTLAPTGSPAFSSAVVKYGVYSHGPVTNGNWYSAPAGLNTAYDGLTTYTIEGWFYLTSITNAPCIIRLNATNYIQVLPTTVFRWGAGGGTLNSSVAVSTLAWYYFAAKWNGTTRTFMVNATTDTVNNSATITTPAILIGRYSSTEVVTGQLDEFSFSNVAQATLPTVDPTGIIRKPRLNLRPSLTSRILDLLLPTSEVWARELDQWNESKRYTAIMDKLSMAKQKLSADLAYLKLTRTPTPKLSPTQTFTNTPVVSPTITPTPKVTK